MPPSEPASAKKKATRKKSTGTATKGEQAVRRRPSGRKRAAKEVPASRRSAGQSKSGAAAQTPAKGGSAGDGKPRKLTARELRGFRELLLAARQRLATQISSLRQESLRQTDMVNSIEDGTAAFDRQFALSLASSEQASVNAIDEALRRVDEKVYGVCEDCGGPIEVARLRALPFVRNCVGCQSERERGTAAAHLSVARRAL